MRTNKLFLNQNGNFKALAEGILVNDEGYWFGQSWGDYNNDGLMDVFVAGFPGALYKNKGNGQFEKVTSGALSQPTLAGICVAWGDFNNDGYLDFILTRPEWLQGPPHCGTAGSPHIMINEGPPDFDFTRLVGTDVSIPEKDTYMQPTLSDYDDDGDLDIFIGMGSGAPKADLMYQNMWEEKGKLDFKKMSGGTLSEDLIEGNQWSFPDIDNDGDLDAFVTNWANMVDNKAIPRPNNLYVNEKGEYKKVKKGALVNDKELSSTCSWGDFDNDGDLDVVIVTDSTYSLRYYKNDGKGNFTYDKAGDLGGIVRHQSGVSAGDYDNDGDLDLYVPGPGENSAFLRNDLDSDNHWVGFKLEGKKSNKSAIGAKLWLKAMVNGKMVTQRREVSGASNFFGTDALNPHFGLGNATEVVHLTVEWPSGKSEVFKKIEIDKLQRIVEGEGMVLIKEIKVGNN